MDLQQIVETNFVANTSAFSGVMAGVVGIMGKVGGAITGVTDQLLKMAGFGDTSLNGLAEKAIEVGSRFEQMTIQIGGMYQALGVSSDMNKGMQVAASTIKKITYEAAKLPGEADAYISVFKAGMPQVRAAMGGTIQDIYKFTDKFTAFGMMQGQSTMQVVTSLEKLTAQERGMASAKMGTWRTLLPFIQSTKEYAHVTAKEFNAMTSTDRVKVLQAGLGKIQPMLDKMANTWQTQVTTLKTTAGIIFRMGTANIFDGMKRGLGAFNSLLMGSDGHLTKMAKCIVGIGQVIGNVLVKAATRLGDILASAASKIKQVGAEFVASPMFKKLDTIVTRIAGLGSKIGGMVAGGAQKLMGGGTESPGMKFLTVALERFNLLSKVLDPVINFLGALANIVITEVLPVFTEIQSVLNGILKPVVKLISSVFKDLTAQVKVLMPTFHNLFNVAKNFYHAVGSVVIPIVRILAKLLAKEFHRSIKTVTRVLEFLGKVVSAFYNKVLIPIISMIGKTLGKLADATAPEDKEEDEGPGLLDGILNALNKQTDDIDKKEKDEAEGGGAAARPSAETYQDFRGSRFDITQKFAEGFDPDRVAVALAGDLGRIGEQKLQSGFEPAFGSR